MKKHRYILMIGSLIATAAHGPVVQGQSIPEAIALTDKEQFERAAAMFKQILATAPNSGQAWFFFGENYYYNDRLDSAEICYDRGSSADPRYPLNHAGLGKIYWIRGEKTEAQVQFDEAIAKATDKALKNPVALQAQTYREVAEGYAAGTADPIKAQELVDKAIALDPKDTGSVHPEG